MKIVIDGKEVNIPPRGPAGPDGNPIGTVISFMGTSAPDGYLVCDGAAYQAADYPALAEHFGAQFGAVNHFGGDGTTTFAVPDMRNLFLRGYHGEAEKQLSGDIGAKQEATLHNNIITEARSAPPRLTSYAYPGQLLWIANTDTEIASTMAYYVNRSGDFPAVSGEASQYTARPVNMAVLYCIKAI